ncbi:MAG TPA: hypothetical protein VGF86_02035, partial [Candidatus Tumulicola sp.]
GALAYCFARPPAFTAGGIDFDAFYCGARLLAASENPYQYEPLRTCEHANRRWANRKQVVAAPLPPYALAMLVPLARLAYPQASLLWFVLLLASMLATIRAVIQLTDLPLLAVGASICIATLIQALPTGALAPIAIASLCIVAVALTRKQWNAATLFLILACLEPHVALPPLIATFVVVREMRIRVILVGVALVALSLLADGVPLNAEYFTSALPAHAWSELGSITQFSLSSMLHNFGVPGETALAVGSLQYGLFALLGLWLAKLLGFEIPATVVLIPMALAVTGGTYIHLSQILAVLPLAFVAAKRGHAIVAYVAIALLTVPWNLLNAFSADALTVPRLADVLARALARQPTPGGMAYVANALVYLGIFLTFWTLLASRSRQLRAGPAAGVGGSH